MNFVEAKRKDLIVESSQDGGMTFNLDHWRLVKKVQGNTLYASQEEFTSEEAQNLIDLLERVKAENIVSPENT